MKKRQEAYIYIYIYIYGWMDGCSDFKEIDISRENMDRKIQNKHSFTSRIRCIGSSSS